MNTRLPFCTFKKLFFPVLFFAVVFHYMTCGTNTRAGTLSDSWSDPVEVEPNEKVVVNKSTSIAVDKKGKPYICYNDISNHRLTYATTDNFGTWTAKSILWNSNTIGASIAVDTKKKIHICYIDDDDNLYYTTNAYDGNLFLTAAIDTSGYPGVNTAIAVDTNDNEVHVHICYYDYFNKVIKYATNVSGTWETADVETIDSLVDDADCSIAAGAISTVDGTVTAGFTSAHISYIGSLVTNYDGHTRTEARLKYATDASGAWTTTVVHPNDSARYGASIAVDKNGIPHISYSTVDKIMYGIYKDGLWFIEQAVPNKPQKSGNFAWKTSLGIDGLGNAHICYYDNKADELMYVTNESGSWRKPKRVADNFGDGGKYNSLDVDTSGKVHISYYDASKRAVMYTAKCIGIATSLTFLTPSDSDLTLHQTGTTTATVTLQLTGSKECPIELKGKKITATIVSGRKLISVEPRSKKTDENGEVEFTISAKSGTGTAKVNFKYYTLDAITNVAVEK
ncbi:MAG: hypothetical protein U0586_12060 [Candidatus Brocadiaceae bacterium]